MLFRDEVVVSSNLRCARTVRPSSGGSPSRLQHPSKVCDHLRMI